MNSFERSGSKVIDFPKSKSAIAIAWPFEEHVRNNIGEHFGAHGDTLSTPGFELEQVMAYIRDQETADDQGRF